MKYRVLLVFSALSLIANAQSTNDSLCRRIADVLTMVETDSVPQTMAQRIFFSSDGEDFKSLISVFDSTEHIKLQRRYGVVNFNEEAYSSKRYTLDFSYRFYELVNQMQTCLVGWSMSKEGHNTFDQQFREAFVFVNKNQDANVVLETTLQSPYKIRVKVF